MRRSKSHERDLAWLMVAIYVAVSAVTSMTADPTQVWAFQAVLATGTLGLAGWFYAHS